MKIRKTKYTLIGLFFLLIMAGCKTNRSTFLQISPPFRGIGIKEEDVTIDPSIKQVARFKNGISVEIPENAFTDKNGNVVKEHVTLSIKKYSSAAEIIASGIPMTYNENGNTANFVSAGMFQITGKAGNTKIFIKEGKKLIVNFPSDVYGNNYDNYYFKITSNDTIASGYWKRLTNNKPLFEPAGKIFGTYKLNFAVDEYPKLAPLETISWRAATPFRNPTRENNKWVLNQKWASVDISQPKKGIGKPLFKSNSSDEYSSRPAFFITKNKSRIITSDRSVIKIWDTSGRLIRTINDVSQYYDEIRILKNKYICVECVNGGHIYDLNGNLICKIDKSFNVHLTTLKKRLIYNISGKPDIVVISNLKGKKIKEIYLRSETKWSLENGIFEQFIVTPEDELITNSLDGITFYDLNGNIIKRRSGHYSYIQYLKKHTLLIERQDGTLTVWDYTTNKEIRSSKQEFDVRTKVTGDTVNYSNSFGIPKTSCIVVNEANSNNSKIWNYAANITTDLDFYTDYDDHDTTVPNLIFGYNIKSKLFHVYDLVKKKDIIRFSDPNSDFGGDGYEYPIFSENKKLLIINSSVDIRRLYSITGKLLFDFKQYDSLIQRCGFINDQRVFSISSDGIFRIWDITGKEIFSKYLKNSEYSYYWQNTDKIIAYNEVFENCNFYDLNGNLLFDPGRVYMCQFPDSNLIVKYGHDDRIELDNLFQRKRSMYQLILRNGSKEFIIYVYLDEDDMQKIYSYYTFRAKELREENKRQQIEATLLRRFSVSKFGIYNCDRLLTDKNAIHFAATFKFDVPVEYNNITIFLITKLNGSCIVKYYNDNRDDLYIDPDVPNMLLAVLPGNKTALFTYKDFRALNYTEIEKDKSYTFKMKTYNKAITSISALDKILKK